MVGRKQSEKTLYLVLTPALLPTGSNCTAAPAHSFSFIPAYLFEPTAPPPSPPSCSLREILHFPPMMTIHLLYNCKALGVITRPNRNFAKISQKARDQVHERGPVQKCVQFHFSLGGGRGGEGSADSFVPDRYNNMKSSGWPPSVDRPQSRLRN